jgi:hypothetical protein
VTRPALGPVARQNALAARASALDASGAHYALFHLSFGPEADQDACERAVDAAEAYQAELAQARAELCVEGGPRAGPDTTAAPADHGDRRHTPAAARRRDAAPIIAHGGDRPGAPR